ncbi:hypothetical protein [Companilactobacillus crustorum]|uniref:hypothetical protein n=1 Tax=Companilactobacillus crustorum TaxID=392416 RepID=UPI000957B218|nr:hypothetical protein [Companilactobacillus crustorum]APU71689.1 hypothetical protein BI355_1371 [Companilactobacillus crustorum]
MNEYTSVSSLEQLLSKIIGKIIIIIIVLLILAFIRPLINYYLGKLRNERFNPDKFNKKFYKKTKYQMYGNGSGAHQEFTFIRSETNKIQFYQDKYKPFLDNLQSKRNHIELSGGAMYTPNFYKEIPSNFFSKVGHYLFNWDHVTYKLDLRA